MERASWKFSEVQKLFELVEQQVPYDEIAQKLGRTERAVRQMRNIAKQWIAAQQGVKPRVRVVKEPVLQVPMVSQERPVWGIAASAVLGIGLGLVLAWVA